MNNDFASLGLQTAEKPKMPALLHEARNKFLKRDSLSANPLGAKRPAAGALAAESKYNT
jgi:hypothetical protein